MKMHQQPMPNTEDGPLPKSQASYRIKVHWSFQHDGIEHAKKTVKVLEVASYDEAEELSRKAAEALEQWPHRHATPPIE